MVSGPSAELSSLIVITEVSEMAAPEPLKVMVRSVTV